MAEGDQVTVNWDPLGDVLHVHVAGRSIRASKMAPHDGDMILDLDSDQQIVGLSILGASDGSSEWWRTHPDAADVPEDLRTAVEQWLSDRATSEHA